MIEPSSGTAKEIKKLTDIVNSTLLQFPLAGLTIHGRSVYVRVDAKAPAPGAAGIGGFIIRPAELMSWKEDELVFLVLHEWSHVFGNHAARLGSRDPEIWNVACDYRVNADCLVILNMQKVPRGGLEPPDWVKDLTPEAIYDQLMKQSSYPPQKAGALGQGDLVDEDMSDPEFDSPGDMKDAFAEELCAAQVSMQATGRDLKEFGDYVAQRVAEIKKGTIPWGRLLLGDVVGHLNGTYATYAPPRRKSWPHLILPSYHDRTERELALLIDVSASAGEAVLAAFTSNVSAAAARAKRTTVITFDQVIREHFTCRDPRDALSKLKLKTGAHSYTDARAAFEEARKLNPSATVCLTDGYIELPKVPVKRTVFAVPRGGATPPWGKTYIMDIAW